VFDGRCREGGHDARFGVVRYVLILDDLMIDLAGRCRTFARAAEAKIQARQSHG